MRPRSGQLVMHEDAEVYLGRAQHARQAAKEAFGPVERRIFEAVAQRYERLASQAERLGAA